MSRAVTFYALLLSALSGAMLAYVLFGMSGNHGPLFATRIERLYLANQNWIAYALVAPVVLGAIVALAGRRWLAFVFLGVTATIALWSLEIGLPLFFD